MPGAHITHKTGLDWRQSILNQLNSRKSIEQTPFEDICSFACNMFDKVDIYKSENIQLNLQREQLQQQLLGIQQTILAGGVGSAAAKAILSKLSIGQDSEGNEASTSSATSKNLSLQHASLLAEKAQLEKKILEIQEQLADVLKSKSDTVQKIVDLRIELDEKERSNRDLTNDIEQKDKEIAKLREALDSLNSEHKTLMDEHLALTMSNKSLEKKHYQLSLEFDLLKQQLIALKADDADRLNAENERILTLQQERMRNEIETNIARMSHVSPTDGFQNIEENFEHLGVSRIPSDVEQTFEPHDGEICAVNWFYCSGVRDDYLATGGSDRRVILWRILDGRCNQLATLLGSNASITSIDIETDSILASSNDFSARIWSFNTRKLMQTLTGHSARVLSAKFLGNPLQIGTGSTDRTVKIWNINRRSCTKTYFAGSTCYDLVYHNNRVISGHFDSKIRCWDLLKPDNNESSGGIMLQAKITSLDISRDGTKLLASLRDNTIKCIDLRKMEVVQTYSDEKFKIGTDFVRAKFSGDGQLVSCGSNDGSLYIWDTNTAKVEKVLTNHNTTLIASCWSPDGKRLVTVDKGKKATIWV